MASRGLLCRFFPEPAQLALWIEPDNQTLHIRTPHLSKSYPLQNGSLELTVGKEFCDVPFDVIAVAQHWNQPVPTDTIPASTAFITMHGWHNDQWFTGPLAFVNKRGGYQVFMPAGTGTALEFDSNDSSEGLTALPDCPTFLGSLRAGLSCHPHLTSFSSIRVEIDRHDAFGYSFLVLLTQAFGYGRVVACQQNPTSDLKHLCQRLGVPLEKDSGAVSLAGVCGYFGKTEEGRITQEVNAASQILDL